MDGDLFIRSTVKYLARGRRRFVSHILSPRTSSPILPTRETIPLSLDRESLSPHDEPLSYIIYRSETTGGPYAYLGETTELEYNDEDVEDGTSYYYVVTANYADGESPYSNEASATPGISISTTDTLSRDDGEPTSFYYGRPGSKFATRFQVDEPCQLLTIYYLTAGDGEFISNVHRWTGTTVGESYLSDRRVHGSDGWTIVDMSPYDLYFVGDFVVSYGNLSSDVYLAADTMGAEEGFSWDYYEERWYSTDYIYYIRVEVRYLATEETATLTGIVTLGPEYSGSLEGSVVQLLSTDFRDTTNADGEFNITEIPPGNYTVKVTHPGFIPHFEELGIFTDLRVSFNLAPYTPPVNPPRFLQARNYMDSSVELYWCPPYGEPGTVEEIAYDDGNPKYYYMAEEGDVEDVRFTVSFPCTLLYVAMAFYDSLDIYDSVEVHIWADDGYGYPDFSSELIPPITAEPEPFSSVTGVKWTILDVSDEELVLPPGEDFHIGYYHISEHPSLLADTLPSESPSRSRLYISDTHLWEQREDYLTRAIVKYYSLGKRTSRSPFSEKDRGLDVLGRTIPEGVRALNGSQTMPSLLEILFPSEVTEYNIYQGTSPADLSLVGTTSDTSYTDTELENNRRYYYQVEAVYPYGISEPTDVVSAMPLETPEEPYVLLVDDDGSGYEPRAEDEGELYISILQELEIPFKAVELLMGENGPSADFMSSYNAVVWWTGVGYTGDVTVTEEDELELASYLDDGGNLFLTGQDYLWDRYLGTSRFSPGDFPYDYLGITQALQDVWTIEEDVITATYRGESETFADGLSFGVLNPFPNWSVYPDHLAGLGQNLFMLLVPGEESGVPTLNYTTTDFKSVFSTVPLLALEDEEGSTKTEMVRRILIDYFDILPPELVDIDVAVQPGWNQVSVPVLMEDMSGENVFPPSLRLPEIYRYNPTTMRYEEVDTVQPGEGYFILFIVDTTITLSGEPVESYRDSVHPGWNMIGSVSESYPIAELLTVPSGILVPPIYWYNPSTVVYDEVSNIDPGLGYWALLIGEGSITLPNPYREKAVRVLNSPVSTKYPTIPPSPPELKQEGKLPSEIILGSKPYPNPFNSTTNIDVLSPRKTSISIKLYNVTGELVREGRKAIEPGLNKVPIDATNLASGLYLYRIESIPNKIIGQGKLYLLK